MITAPESVTQSIEALKRKTETCRVADGRLKTPATLMAMTGTAHPIV